MISVTILIVLHAFGVCFFIAVVVSIRGDISHCIACFACFFCVCSVVVVVSIRGDNCHYIACCISMRSD